MPADDLLERMIRDYGDALLRTCYLYLKDYHNFSESQWMRFQPKLDN